jgi:cytochrome P450
VPDERITARSFFRDPVAAVAAHAGDARVVLARGPGRFALVRDPDAIWHVLVTDAASFRPGKWKRRARRFLGPTLNTLDGREHRTRRVLLHPSLDRRRMAGFDAAVAARAEEAQARFEEGVRVTLRDVLDRYSLLVAGDVLLSADLGADADRLVAALRAVMASVPRLTPPVRRTRHGNALREVETHVDGLLAARRKAPRGTGDLLDALATSGLPDRTVRGEVIAFLLAAVDEPPSALEAAWWLLGRDPAAEARFHADVDADPPGPYVHAVLQETLRLFPPARHIDRCPAAETQIDGVRVKAGTNVLISPLVTHHEADLYERAGEFVPERWLGGRAERPRGAYLPFGAGPHSCIGEPLARMIAVAGLVAIGRRWRLRVDADAPSPGPRRPPLTVTPERR